MKSILHVALIAPGGYSNAGLMKAFFDNGFSEYTCFDFQEKTFNSDRGTMRKMLIKEAERLKPDMIFMQIQASDILDVDTFKSLSKISFTVNYTFDIRTVEQTEWLYNLAPILGLICFSNQRDVDICNAMGFPNVMVLQSSADTEVYDYPKYKKEDGSTHSRNGIVFIGNNYENSSVEFPLSKERREMVDFLKKEFPDRFKVYGNNWNGSRMVSQKEEVEIYQTADISICHNNFEAELYTSDRIWRSMLCGTLCLTKYFKGIDSLFVRNRHLDWWETFEELKDKINLYSKQTIRAGIIRINGFDHVHYNHTWTERIKGMMNLIEEFRFFYEYAFVLKDQSDACLKAGAHVIDGVIPHPFDEKFNGRTCDCKKTKWLWAECGCGNKEFQLRAQENI